MRKRFKKTKSSTEPQPLVDPEDQKFSAFHHRFKCSYCERENVWGVFLRIAEGKPTDQMLHMVHDKYEGPLQKWSSQFAETKRKENPFLCFGSCKRPLVGPEFKLEADRKPQQSATSLKKRAQEIEMELSTLENASLEVRPIKQKRIDSLVGELIQALESLRASHGNKQQTKKADQNE